MNTFFQHLGDPEYMHVLLNPLPVYGLGIATLGLLLALIARNRRAVVITLALIFVSGLSAWPTYQYGESAYDRVKAMSDPAGEQWLDAHMARAENLISAFYIVARLAVVAMLAPIKWPGGASTLSIITLIVAAATLGIGCWIAYAGGHVRHKEFRFEPPPPARGEEHHHGEEQPAASSHQHETEQSPTESPQPHTEHTEHEQMSPSGEQPKTEEEKKQLEASRLQLEASRLQLEASRKQLEAAGGGSPSPSARRSPGISATPQPSPEQHKHDEGRHNEHKP